MNTNKISRFSKGQAVPWDRRKSNLSKAIPRKTLAATSAATILVKDAMQSRFQGAKSQKHDKSSSLKSRLQHITNAKSKQEKKSKTERLSRAAALSVTGDAGLFRNGGSAAFSDVDRESQGPWSDNPDKKSRDEQGDMPYEMAPVEIDLAYAQNNMDEILTKMLSEGRITVRQREIYSAKFDLMLQGLISFQERELEVIESLNTKSDILVQLNNFVALEESYNQAGGIERNIDTADSHGATDDEGRSLDGGPEKGQGLSVAEMSATAIRENLLMQKNKLEMLDHMRNIHVLELRQLEFEKALLDIHYSKMTKPTDVQRETKELKRTVNDLRMQVSQIDQEMQQYERDIALEEKALLEDELSVDKLDLDVLTKQMQVQSNANKPVHLAKEADRDAYKLEQLTDENEVLNNRFLEETESFRTEQSTLDGLLSDLNSLIKEETRLAQLRKHGLSETESLGNQLELLITREQQLNERHIQTTDKVANAVKLRRTLQEEVYTVSNETNKAIREASKLERTLRMNQEAHINAKLAYDKMRIAFETARPKEDSSNWEKLTRVLQREITGLKQALNQKLDEATVKAELVEMLQKRLNQLYDEQVSSGKELQNMIRTTVRKRREREEKSEQCIKLEGQLFKLAQESKMLKLTLDDCARNERDLHRAMGDVKLQYNKIKIARAALMNDLIGAKQKVSEQGEKLKICTNEIESYTNQCMERESEIHRAHYLTLNASLARDSVRNHAMRSREKYRIHVKEKSELTLTNDTLRKEISRLKVDVNQARANFQEATHQCNQTAMKVRERTEEICIVTEKTKAFDLILLRGNRALSIREMEKAKLTSILQELLMRANILFAKQPDDDLMARRVEKLRKEFYDTAQYRRSLENKLNDVSNPARVRELRMDLLETKETVPVLQTRLSELEESLAKSQCQVLEKELVIKQVAYATEDSMEKANLLKGKYKEHSAVLCSLRKQLYCISFKIDGMISEASIAITQSELAQKEYEELKNTLEQAEKRLAKGMPPLDHMLDEWKRLMWRNKMLEKSKQNSSKRFLVEHKKPKGSQIVMERFRPKPRTLC